MRSISAIRYQRSGNKKKKDYAEITESAEVAEEEKGNTTQERFIAQKTCDAKPYLSARPDAPDCGAKEKIGPLRSE